MQVDLHDPGRPKVLVVDDEYLIARDIGEALTEIGWEVVGRSGSLDDALQIAKREKPELIVTDLNLGEGDEGHRLVDQLNPLGTTFFLVLSGDEAACDRFAQSFERWPILRKPVRLDALKKAAMTLMGDRRERLA